MNISTTIKKFLYVLMIVVMILLLIREYLYIHPYNPSPSLFGPKWTYISTKTFTWWFLLGTSLVFITPLIRKQKIGFFGLVLFVAVLIRPLVQEKFPEQSVGEFYSERKVDLKDIVSNTEMKNQTISNERIKKLGFEKLIVQDSIFYFFCYDEEFLVGICYTQQEQLPKRSLTFGRYLKFNEIENEWYELE